MNPDGMDCGSGAAMTAANVIPGHDPVSMHFKRFTPWDKTRWRFGVRLLRNL